MRCPPLPLRLVLPRSWSGWLGWFCWAAGPVSLLLAGAGAGAGAVDAPAELPKAIATAAPSADSPPTVITATRAAPTRPIMEPRVLVMTRLCELILWPFCERPACQA